MTTTHTEQNSAPEFHGATGLEALEMGADRIQVDDK